MPFFWKLVKCTFLWLEKLTSRFVFLLAVIRLCATSHSPHQSQLAFPVKDDKHSHHAGERKQTIKKKKRLAEGETFFAPLLHFRGTWTWCRSCDPSVHYLMYVRSAGRVTWPVCNHTHTHARAVCNVLSTIVLFLKIFSAAVFLMILLSSFVKSFMCSSHWRQVVPV